MIRHAYLPTLMITDKNSVYVSNVIHKTADVLSITHRHATTKHARTVQVLGRTHATIKTKLKFSSREFRKQLQKQLTPAILIHNTIYHTSSGCEPSQIVNGREPYNILDHKLGVELKTGAIPTKEFAEGLLRKTQILYEKTKKNVIQ